MAACATVQEVGTFAIVLPAQVKAITAEFGEHAENCSPSVWHVCAFGAEALFARC
jgi:hypothetical protein